MDESDFPLRDWQYKPSREYVFFSYYVLSEFISSVYKVVNLSQPFVNSEDCVSNGILSVSYSEIVGRWTNHQLHTWCLTRTREHLLDTSSGFKNHGKG